MNYKWWITCKEPPEFFIVEQEVNKKSFTEKHSRVKIMKKMKRMEHRLINALDFPKEKKVVKVYAVLNTPTGKKLNEELTKNQMKRKRKALAKVTKNRNW